MVPGLVADVSKIAVVRCNGIGDLVFALPALGSSGQELAGRVSLGALLGVLERCELVVGNDGGPLHLAAAVGVPTVGIFWASNLVTAPRCSGPGTARWCPCGCTAPDVARIRRSGAASTGLPMWRTWTRQRSWPRVETCSGRTSMTAGPWLEPSSGGPPRPGERGGCEVVAIGHAGGWIAPRRGTASA